MKRLAIWKVGCVLVLLLVMAACGGSDDSDDIPGPTSTPEPVTVVWQRPQSAVQQDLFADVRLTGIMRLHQQTVNDVAFSQSGTRMASVGADGYLAVWNLANGESLFVQIDTDGRRVFFSPNDEYVYTVSSKGLVRQWNMIVEPPRALEQVAKFSEPGSMAGVMAQSNARSLLALGSVTGDIDVWRIPENEVSVEIAAHTGAVQTVAFSPDDRLIASIGVDQAVRLWSIADGELALELYSPDLTPLHVVFAPDGQRLAVAYVTGVQLWDLEQGEMIAFASAPANTAAAALAFSPDGSLLAGCGPQPTVAVWDGLNGDSLGGLAMPETACRNLLFSPDSKLLLTIPLPGRDVYLWDMLHMADDVPPEEKQLRRRNRDNMGLVPGTRFFDIAWSDDGRFIVLLDELGPMYAVTAAG